MNRLAHHNCYKGISVMMGGGLRQTVFILEMAGIMVAEDFHCTCQGRGFQLFSLMVWGCCKPPSQAPPPPAESGAEAPGGRAPGGGAPGGGAPGGGAPGAKHILREIEAKTSINHSVINSQGAVALKVGSAPRRTVP